jgi:hypothetical protein
MFDPPNRRLRAKGIAGKALEEIEGLNIPLLENPVERVDVT